MQGNPDQLPETFCHELMHQVLPYKNNVEKWLIEGMADYGNYYYGTTSPQWHRDSFNNTPRNDISWQSGYQHTAKFLMWLDTKFPGFTLSLHKACLQGTYKKQKYFIDKTDKTMEQLWALYRKSNFKIGAAD
ncbi:basic secretory family protein [Niabella beijingensis]|uniref:basic secretory family protein n=2 Tax=Niabella beijingensis TaxID=2872700 RepID=UPI001CBF3105|nr:basic secretory family protein [Niabella beijingensis]MBZ4191605.1 basic secretory family protein [Niabella beijingensis]